MHTEPQQEHRWLQRMVGEWEFENECSMGPDQASIKSTGRDVVRSLGGLWVLCEGTNEIPSGDTAISLLSLGYDPARQRFVGTFLASIMAHLWVYDGSLDAAGNVPTLDTEGPTWQPEGGTARYQDVIEFFDSDHRTLTSRMLDANGNWNCFMKAHYRRVK